MGNSKYRPYAHGARYNFKNLQAILSTEITDKKQTYVVGIKRSSPSQFISHASVFQFSNEITMREFNRISNLIRTQQDTFL